MGRLGTVELIQLFANKTCFLLDVGRGKWKEKILAFAKKVLEDANVLKIIHNSSMGADALLHLHNITVCNVLDTQVHLYESL